MNMKNGLLAGAFALMAVVAAVGWTKAAHNTAPATAVTSPLADPSQPQATQPAQTADYSPNSAQTASYPNAAPASATNAVYSQQQYSQPQAESPCVPAGYEPAEGYVQSIPRPVIVRRYDAVQSQPVYAQGQPVYASTAPVQTQTVYTHYRHHRSVGKSVAIVAGSAGVGAAIGGIAGGGKGAGIGALAGGAGGFIYDRLTHNH